MAKTIICGPVTVVAWVRFFASPREMCGELGGIGTVFFFLPALPFLPVSMIVPTCSVCFRQACVSHIVTPSVTGSLFWWTHLLSQSWKVLDVIFRNSYLLRVEQVVAAVE